MPSWRIHEKYSGLMGIPIDVAKEVNKLIDDPRWHDFFDTALTRSSTPHLGVLGGRVVTYYFDGSFLYTPTYEPVRQRLEKLGREGFRAFFLHIYLDLIERNMHSGVASQRYRSSTTAKSTKTTLERLKSSYRLALRRS